MPTRVPRDRATCVIRTRFSEFRPSCLSANMSAKKLGKQVSSLLRSATKLAADIEADGLLVLVQEPIDLRRIEELVDNRVKLILAADSDDLLDDVAEESKAAKVQIEMEEAPVYEVLTQAMLDCVADEILRPGATVCAVYSGFEADRIDSVSIIKLSEHLGRLTARDLQKLETHVPLETLKAVVDLAVDIGREGREGKPVGSIFVVGDHRKVMAQSRSVGFDPVKGYKKVDRNLSVARTKEAIKEIAQLDGAFIVAADGTVEGAGRYIQTAPVDLTMTSGLGARHWAAAAISKNTKAIAVVVSESSGTVRIFQNGQCVLRIEPFRRAMKWREFLFEPPNPSSDG